MSQVSATCARFAYTSWCRRGVTTAVAWPGTPAFAALWSMCRARGLTVVGDVHTHPGGAFQSEADRTNPMVAREGHIAIIVPNYATGRPATARIGVYEYRGNHEWADHSGALAHRFLHNDFWSTFL